MQLLYDRQSGVKTKFRQTFYNKYNGNFLNHQYEFPFLKLSLVLFILYFYYFVVIVEYKVT